MKNDTRPMTKTREQKNYGELIGRIDDEYYFLDYTFDHGDFKGATGTVLRPIPKDEWEQRCEPENLEEENRESWQYAVSEGNTDLGLTEWMEYNDISEPYIDDSGWKYNEELRSKAGLSEEAYPMIECTGGGRCFDTKGARDQEFDEVYNAELLAVIQKNVTLTKQQELI